MSTASDMKYNKALIGELQNEFNNPSDEFVKLFASRVYDGKLTQQVKEKFSDIISKSMSEFIRLKVNDRLKNAMDSSVDSKNTSKDEKEEVDIVEDNGIVTTDEEIEAFRIIQSITSEIDEPDNIYMRDSKSYCAILYKDNNRKTIARLYFLKTKMSIGIFCEDKEEKINIEKLSDIYKYKELIKRSITQFIDG